jgi:hypothetical protein
MKLLGSRNVAPRIDWLQKHRKQLFELELNPHIKASYLRTEGSMRKQREEQAA